MALLSSNCLTELIKLRRFNSVDQALTQFQIHLQTQGSLMLLTISIVVTIAYVYMCVKIYRSHGILYALFTFLIFIPVLVPLFANWGDEDNDIRWPFALSVGLPILLAIVIPDAWPLE
jgi:uncharacterized membrane protein (DUF106 family)